MGVDVAENRVKEAIERYNARFALHNNRSYNFSAFWIVGDCFHPSLRNELEFVDFFDVVSCQFAMHYSFETEARAKDFLGNVAYKLRPGGHFIATTPDARVLYRNALASSDGKSFGNMQYNIVFDDKVERKPSDASAPLAASGSPRTGDKKTLQNDFIIKNGERYTFWMQDSVDLPEYIVDPDILVRWCAELDLELVRMENFQDRYERKSADALNGEGTPFDHPPERESLNDETWDTFGIYTTFIFRKKGTPKTKRHSRKGYIARMFDPDTDVISLHSS